MQRLKNFVSQTTQPLFRLGVEQPPISTGSGPVLLLFALLASLAIWALTRHHRPRCPQASAIGTGLALAAIGICSGA